MTYKKRVPHQKAQGSYTTWVEVELTDEESTQAETTARNEHIDTYKQCIDDAKEIALSCGIKVFDKNVIEIANSLFEKRASHTVYYKDEMIQDKFDKTVTNH